jgi:Na+(H+)/acetate symporter ActP
MLRQDNFAAGFLAGLVCSVIFYVIFNEINVLLIEHVFPSGQGFSEQFVAIVAVCTNLLPFLIFNAADKAKSMKGVIGATIMLAAVAIIFYHDRFF